MILHHLFNFCVVYELSIDILKITHTISVVPVAVSWVNYPVILPEISLRQLQKYNGPLLYKRVNDQRREYDHEDRAKRETEMELLPAYISEGMFHEK